MNSIRYRALISWALPSVEGQQVQREGCGGSGSRYKQLRSLGILRTRGDICVGFVLQRTKRRLPLATCATRVVNGRGDIPSQKLNGGNVFIVNFGVSRVLIVRVV